MRKRATVESSPKQAPGRVVERENAAYCFTLRALTAIIAHRRRLFAPSSFPPAGSPFFPGSRKYCRLPRGENADGAAREISKCSSIIKVYRFTDGRLSYANLAGGHPLGLFLQISRAVSMGNGPAGPLEVGKCECTLSLLLRLHRWASGEFGARRALSATSRNQSIDRLSGPSMFKEWEKDCKIIISLCLTDEDRTNIWLLQFCDTSFIVRV